jgi:hypothetical protein
VWVLPKIDIKLSMSFDFSISLIWQKDWGSKIGNFNTGKIFEEK